MEARNRKQELLKAWREEGDHAALEALRAEGLLKPKRITQFGIEIEFFGCSPRTVVDKMAAKGIACEYEGYNHRDRTDGQWKIVTDSTVCSSGTGCGSGLELVSPILYGNDGLKALRKAVKALNEAGAKVDISCGVHIHHDATMKRKMGVGQLQNVGRIYSLHHDQIDSMLAASRREHGAKSTWCKSLRGRYDELMNANTLASFRGRIPGRYFAVNYEAYLDHGSIEFRQHQGSTDIEKIEQWLRFTGRLMSAAYRGKHINANVSLWDLLEMTDAEIRFWEHRIATFRGADQRAEQAAARRVERRNARYGY